MTQKLHIKLDLKGDLRIHNFLKNVTMANLNTVVPSQSYKITKLTQVEWINSELKRQFYKQNCAVANL